MRTIYKGREYLLSNVNSKDVGLAVMKVVDTLQAYPSHVQVAALSTAFVMAIDRYGVPGSIALQIAENILLLSNSKELKAAEQYMQHEWKE